MTEAEIMEEHLRGWTSQLDHTGGLEIRAIMAAAATQLGQRIGPEAAAHELQELAASMFRGTRQ